MIMMPYRWPRPSPQLTGQADFWHPTRCRRPLPEADQTPACPRRPHQWVWAGRI